MAGGPLILDITRLTARAGLPPTGIDRVERRWLGHLMAGERPLWGLARTRLGHLLVDDGGMRGLGRSLLTGQGLPGPDMLSRFTHRRALSRAAAETAVRQAARMRVRSGRLAGALGQIPGGALYLNLGHLGLDLAVLGGMRRVGIPARVLIHDTIPLDHPEWSRPEAPPRHRRLLANVASTEAEVFTPSDHAAERLISHAPGLAGRVTVAPLGVEVAAPDPETALPDAPYFLCLGTIEGRKDIGLLLDVWARLGPSPPTLLLCGKRGWRAQEVFARLDARPPGVIEMPDLSDGAVSALITGARALLMPSRAEGFGLPPFEALALGTLPLVADLPVWDGRLGPEVPRLPPGDTAAWAGAIERLASRPGGKIVPTIPLPDWDNHFRIVLRDRGSTQTAGREPHS